MIIQMKNQATNVIEVTNVTPELSINKTSDKTNMPLEIQEFTH